VTDDAQRIEVGRTGGGLAERLLRTDVRRSAEQIAGAGVSRRIGRAGDAEVGELHQSVLAHQDVGGLDVAMDDVRLVSHAEGEGALAEH
jgi:hypothetical protein